MSTSLLSNNLSIVNKNYILESLENYVSLTSIAEEYMQIPDEWWCNIKNHENLLRNCETLVKLLCVKLSDYSNFHEFLRKIPQLYKNGDEGYTNINIKNILKNFVKTRFLKVHAPLITEYREMNNKREIAYANEPSQKEKYIYTNTNIYFDIIKNISVKRKFGLSHKLILLMISYIGHSQCPICWHRKMPIDAKIGHSIVDCPIFNGIQCKNCVWFGRPEKVSRSHTTEKCMYPQQCVSTGFTDKVCLSVESTCVECVDNTKIKKRLSKFVPPLVRNHPDPLTLNYIQTNNVNEQDMNVNPVTIEQCNNFNVYLNIVEKFSFSRNPVQPQSNQPQFKQPQSKQPQSKQPHSKQPQLVNLPRDVNVRILKFLGQGQSYCLFCESNGKTNYQTHDSSTCIYFNEHLQCVECKNVGKSDTIYSSHLSNECRTKLKVIHDECSYCRKAGKPENVIKSHVVSNCKYSNKEMQCENCVLNNQHPNICISHTKFTCKLRFKCDICFANRQSPLIYCSHTTDKCKIKLKCEICYKKKRSQSIYLSHATNACSIDKKHW